MNTRIDGERVSRIAAALAHSGSSVRLKAALAAGSEGDPALTEALVRRCDVEPDFFVRDMLTWALTRMPAERAVPLLLAELDSPASQARSQALHTLSKIRPEGAFDAITDSMISDDDDEVARAAWRSAVILVPGTRRAELAQRLATQLGRGSMEILRSLGMAFVELGGAAAEALEAAADGADAVRAAHARATLHLLSDPEASFGYALHEANRDTALAFRETETG